MKFASLLNNKGINKKIKLWNGDCMKVMDVMKEEKSFVDVVLTSPFYNTARKNRRLDTYEGRYDIHLDNMSDQEYIDFTVELFNKYDSILNKNGTVLYNLSYGAENTHLMWLVVAEIIKSTSFTVADTIIWKKKSALPNNTSSNRLTRITEYVFVFCRKTETKTFNANKKITKQNSRGQNYYENIFNFIEAKNNDGSCKLNKATFSTDFAKRLLEMYAKENAVIYDSFMGTGTTANACKELGLECIGSELSEAQWEYSQERLLER